MSFYMYILKCSDGSYYIGHTDNLEARYFAHQQKIFRCYTNNRLPVELVYYQDFGTREEAFSAERQVKNWSRKKKEALIAQQWQKLKTFSKKQFTK